MPWILRSISSALAVSLLILSRSSLRSSISASNSALNLLTTEEISIFSTMYRRLSLSNTRVKQKIVRQSNAVESRWSELAEDAERDIEKARLRIKQLREAARIFRRNAESGFAFPGQVQESDGKRQANG